MRVLVACEFSGIVRDAFRARGHYAVSCDLLDTERDPSHHFKGDVRNYFLMGSHLYGYWDLMIAFPPCTYLCNSGVRWLYRNGARKFGTDDSRWHRMKDAATFVKELWNAPVEKIAIENPRMHGYGQVLVGWDQDDGPESQVIHPHQFGHGETKATCLRLKGLPKLVPTKIVTGRRGRVHHEPPSPNRWKNRSRTYQGIADAMAAQWG